MFNINVFTNNVNNKMFYNNCSTLKKNCILETSFPGLNYFTNYNNIARILNLRGFYANLKERGANIRNSTKRDDVAQ